MNRERSRLELLAIFVEEIGGPDRAPGTALGDSGRSVPRANAAERAAPPRARNPEETIERFVERMKDDELRTLRDIINRETQRRNRKPDFMADGGRVQERSPIGKVDELVEDASPVQLGLVGALAIALIFFP